ncbi:MAG: asparagine synthase (glutamine-hydrolyzing) [Deltaproteobacteria bacterium]|nr:asparagine synthase (glutamine-hydrolyzing) [Deltaproteobacteria bacterium]
MCGIVGIVSQGKVVDQVTLEVMRDSMRHRGPDDAGLWRSANGRIGLAHRRLAVIDLSPGGHQPMVDASGQLCITFNGEIYNYQELRRELEAKGHSFQSASDTEVILEAYRAWGTDCLPRFNGMFAFGLFDSKEQQLFLARDRAGKKPLFYYQTAGQFLFASELKALMAHKEFPRILDLEALNFYLAYGYVPGEKCILQGVHKLPPAHAMIYDVRHGGAQVWRYWSLPEAHPRDQASVEELVEELEAHLLDSVRLRLIADVPVGISLSGGLDSSLVTAMAARISARPVKTFNISFPGHGRYDEGPHARLVARHFGTEHTELVADPATVELLPRLARQFDEPLADHSMVPTYLVSQLLRQEVTVALGGDGGDELFGGYPHYNFLLKQEQYRHLIPARIRAWAGAAAAHFLPLGLPGRNHLIGFNRELPWSIAHINLYFDAYSRKRLLSPLIQNGGRADAAPEAYRAGLCQAGASPLYQAAAADFQTTLPEDYLVKVDRASMLCSLEMRSPFLDHRLVEFAFGRLPDRLRVAGDQRKILLSTLAQRLLPKELDLVRKQGFEIPLAHWLKGEWGNYVETVLQEANPQIFDRRVVQGLMTGQRQGYANANRLFLLTMFELWRREYRITVPAQGPELR